MVVKGKVGSIPVQFYCLSLHIKSIVIACGIGDVWAGSMYWLSSKWSDQIWYELFNCFAVFEPRSPGLVFMTHFLDLLTIRAISQKMGHRHHYFILTELLHVAYQKIATYKYNKGMMCIFIIHSMTQRRAMPWYV